MDKKEEIKKRYRTLVTALHYKKEDGMMVINPEPYIWKVGRKALKEGEVIEKGDIVFGKIKYKDGKTSCKPVLVIDVKTEEYTKESKKYKSIVKLIEKGKK